MNFYYAQNDVPEEVKNVILTADLRQFGWHTNETNPELVLDLLVNRMSAGSVVVCYYKNCVFFITDYFPGVVLLDSLRGKDASIFDYIAGVKELLRYLEDSTKIHKVVTKTPFKELNKLQKKIGFEIEGTHKEEYLMPDGTYADTYSFGYILRR